MLTHVHVTAAFADRFTRRYQGWCVLNATGPGVRSVIKS